MVEILEAFLSVVLVGLSSLLASVALLANRYYSDRRFVMVGAGLIGLAAVGVISLVSVLSSVYYSSLDVGELPLIVLVIVALLLNASLMRRAKPAEEEAAG